MIFQLENLDCGKSARESSLNHRRPTKSGRSLEASEAGRSTNPGGVSRQCQAMWRNQIGRTKTTPGGPLRTSNVMGEIRGCQRYWGGHEAAVPSVWGSGSENSASVKGPGVRAQGIGKWAELQWSPGVWAERTQPSLES